jgi:hypothetical protein
MLRSVGWTSIEIDGLSDHKVVLAEVEAAPVGEPVDAWNADAVEGRPAEASADELAAFSVQPTEHSTRKCFKIVLTGGPCGGKSSAICKVRLRLERLGFQVILVQETVGLGPVSLHCTCFNPQPCLLDRTACARPHVAVDSAWSTCAVPPDQGVRLRILLHLGVGRLRI